VKLTKVEIVWATVHKPKRGEHWVTLLVDVDMDIFLEPSDTAFPEWEDILLGVLRIWQ